MQELIFVTTNEKKFEEVKDVLKDYSIKLKQSKLEMVEPDLDTIEDIALEKAKIAFKKLKQPLIVEDTGVYFKAYKNFPGPMAKRVYISLGFAGIFRLLKGRKRTGSLKSAFCLVSSPRNFKLFTGEMHGRFTKTIQGKTIRKVPYTNIFIPDGQKKTVGRLNLKEKNQLSQRAKAARKIGRFLTK
jgi:XTP/dITP diphosphohydrolase